MSMKRVHGFQQRPAFDAESYLGRMPPAFQKLNSLRAVESVVSPDGSVRNEAPKLTVAELLDQLNTTSKRRSNFQVQVDTVAANTPIQVLESRPRDYFLIQNRDLVNDLLIGFDFTPSSTRALVLPAGQTYEPFQVPQNAVYLNATAAVAYTLIYA